jgi:putative peptide zinc metalloprotease protein
MVAIDDAWLCPDLSEYWVLGRDRATGQFFLKAKHCSLRHPVTEVEVLALQYFRGHVSVQYVQQVCKQKQRNIPNDFVKQLWQRLVELEILCLEESVEELRSVTTTPSSNEPRLKSYVQWIQTNDGDWIMRNPNDLTFVQLDDLGKEVVEQLGTMPIAAIAQTYDLSRDEIKALLQQLTLTGMLEGTEPPKPPKKKFTPMQLLFFKWSLWNPDTWLTTHIDRWRWIWSRPFWLTLCIVLTGTGAIALHQRTDLLWTAQLFLSHLSFGITATFAILVLVVVTLHELGHAFTLKHYGGIVPEVGVMFMFFMPVAYTNTTDQYSLSKRSQRMLVVGAGVLCQLIIATFAFWLWNSSATGSWLWIFSYLLFAASVFTVAINLNPLAKFDGYYLAVAMTGINNLRQRSFEFYRDLLTLKPSLEEKSDRWLLAAYAPFSLLYTLSVFGFLILKVTDWTLTFIPFTALVLFASWAIYFYLTPKPRS